MSNFFPSISSKIVIEVWVGVFGFSPEIAEYLTKLICYKGFLVQGAKPSSYICNLVLWERESKLYNELLQKNYTYTRFVDDITISFPVNISKEVMSEVIGKVYSMLSSIEVKPNKSKHKVMTTSHRQHVHNVNIGRGAITLPKKERRKIESAVFECETKYDKLARTSEYESLYNSTMGRVNTMKRIHNKKGSALVNRLLKIRPITI